MEKSLDNIILVTSFQTVISLRYEECLHVPLYTIGGASRYVPMWTAAKRGARASYFFLISVCINIRSFVAPIFCNSLHVAKRFANEQ